MDSIRVTIVEEITNIRVVIQENNSGGNTHAHGNFNVLELITEAFNTALKNNILSANAHLIDTNNPHNVTKVQVGLANVDNTADVNKPVSIAMATAIANALVSAQDYADGLFNTLVGASPTDMDTLQEISTALQNNPHIIAEIITSLGKRLRFDIANQGLSSTEKTNALTNLGIQNIDNTSDVDKPLSNAIIAALLNKVNVVSGMGLSSNDLTDGLKSRIEKSVCNIYKSAVDSAAVNGPITEQILQLIPIVAGDISIEEVIYTEFNFRITGTSGNKSMRFLWNTLPQIAGATPIGIYTIASNKRLDTFKRKLTVKSTTNVETVGPGRVLQSDELGDTSPAGNLNINLTIAGYFIITTTNLSNLDSIVLSSYKISK